MATRKTKPVSAETAPDQPAAAAPQPAPRKAAKKAAAKAVKKAVKKAAVPRKKAAAAPAPVVVEAPEPIPGAGPEDKFPLSFELMDEEPEAPPPPPEKLREEITRQAFQYWVDRGYRPGDPNADWLRAEDEVLKRYGLR